MPSLCRRCSHMLPLTRALLTIHPACRRKFAVPVSQKEVERDWAGQGFHCGCMVDPPGGERSTLFAGGPGCVGTAAHLLLAGAAAATSARIDAPAHAHPPDTAGHEWNNFTHTANELVTVVEGRMRFTFFDSDHFILEPGGAVGFPGTELAR